MFISSLWREAMDSTSNITYDTCGNKHYGWTLLMGKTQ